MRAEARAQGLPKGSAMDCLKHYLEQLPWGDQSSTEARKPMADFLGINSDSIRRWFTGDTQPKGLVLVKLRYFLEDQGYRIEELEGLQPLARQLGRLISNGVISYEETAKELGFTEVSDILRALHAKAPFSSKQMAGIARICAEHPLEVQETTSAPAIALLSRAVALQGQARSAIRDRVEEDIIHLLDGLNGLCAVLEPRLEHMLSDGFTPEQRQAFREKAGRHRVFDMANRFYRLNKQLNALCSEKAREITSTTPTQNQR